MADTHQHSFRLAWLAPTETDRSKWIVLCECGERFAAEVPAIAEVPTYVPIPCPGPHYPQPVWPQPHYPWIVTSGTSTYTSPPDTAITVVS